MSKKVLAILIGLLVITGGIYLMDLQKEVEEDADVLDAITEGQSNVQEREEGLVDEEEITYEELENEDEVAMLVDCLEEKNMIVYGSKTCPACTNFANSFGGYDKIEQIYVECTEDWDRCYEEKKTEYVPEIQIGGELYQGGRALSTLADYTGCQP